MPDTHDRGPVDAPDDGPDDGSDDGPRGNLGGKVAGFTVLGLLLLVAAAWVGLYLYSGDTAPRGARVEGISIAGLEPAEAEDRLRKRLEERATAPIPVTYGDGRSTDLDPARAGLSVDYRASVEQAGAGGGFGPRRMWTLLTGGGNTRAEVVVDEARMQRALEDIDDDIGSPAVEAKVVFREGRAVATRGRPGRVVDRDAAQQLLADRFLRGGTQKLPTRIRRPQVSEEAVQRALTEFGRPAMSGPVTLVLGGQRVQAPPRLFGKALSMEPRDGELVPRVDGKALVESLQPVMRTVGREPRDARIELRDGKPRVVPARVGVEMDPRELEAEFAAVAVRRGQARRLEVSGRTTQPALTTAEARALKVTEQVSTFTTRFPYAEYRNVNLARAAELIDGTLLEPGEVFSLNETVGERTAENGFTEGYIVSDGIFKKDLGGGVSQIATTTFNAMFFAGLEDVEHKPHSVYIDRYPEGREATVAWPTVDLRFRNDSPHGVLIKASVQPSSPGGQGSATVSMYSTKRWEITASKGPRRNFKEPGTRYLTDEDCEEFEGTTGFTVDVFRYFRDPDSGKVQRTEKFRTDYIAGDTVRCGPEPQ